LALLLKLIPAVVELVPAFARAVGVSSSLLSLEESSPDFICTGFRLFRPVY